MKNSKVKIVVIGETAINMANKLYEMENVEILKEDYSELLNLNLENTVMILFILSQLTDEKREGITEMLKEINKSSVLTGIYNIGNENMDKLNSEADFYIDFDNGIDLKNPENRILPGIEGIVSSLVAQGFINIELEDIENILKNAGEVHLVYEIDQIKNLNVFLEKINEKIKKIRNIETSNFNILLIIYGGRDIGLHEIRKISENVSFSIFNGLKLLWSVIIDKKFKNKAGAVIYFSETTEDSEKMEKGLKAAFLKSFEDKIE